jgi:hypothetical protein
MRDNGSSGVSKGPEISVLGDYKIRM